MTFRRKIDVFGHVCRRRAAKQIPPEAGVGMHRIKENGVIG
jgi:hypothetical protein